MCISNFDVDPGGKIKARPRSTLLKLFVCQQNSRADLFRKKSLTKAYVALLLKLKSNLSAQSILYY